MPSVVVTSHSTVGFPRESKIWRAVMLTIFDMIDDATGEMRNRQKNATFLCRSKKRDGVLELAYSSDLSGKDAPREWSAGPGCVSMVAARDARLSEESTPLIARVAVPVIKQKSHYLVVPALFVVQLSFSASAILQSVMMREVEVDAAVFSFARCALSTVMLFAMAARSSSGVVWPCAEDATLLMLCGVGGMYFGQLYLLLALKHVSVLNYAVISALQPVSTMFVGHVAGIEPIELRSRSGQLKLVGVLLAVGGGTVIVSSQANGPGNVNAPGNVLVGNVFALLFMFGASCYPLLQKQLLGSGRLNQANVTAWGMASGTLCIGLTLPVRFSDSFDMSDSPFFTFPVLLVLFYMALVASALSYSLITWALDHSSPVFVITFSPLQLVMTASFAALFMGDAVLLAEALGMVSVCLGLWLLAASRAFGADSERASL